MEPVNSIDDKGYMITLINIHHLNLKKIAFNLCHRPHTKPMPLLDSANLI